MKRLDEFVPADHRSRRIREMVNEALMVMDELSDRMYEADNKGGRPGIAPEKLLRSHAAIGALQRSLRAHADGADSLQHALSPACGSGHGRYGVGLYGVHKEPSAPDRQDRFARVLDGGVGLTDRVRPAYGLFGMRTLPTSKPKD